MNAVLAATATLRRRAAYRIVASAERTPVRTVGRTAFLALWLTALAIAGSPVWLASLLGVVLVGVWLAPLVLTPPPLRPVEPPAGSPGTGVPSSPGPLPAG
jgi:hypothetical protein